jgi:SpoVK/Ycf46/Vps4 family AAA+-type ATPase
MLPLKNAAAAICIYDNDTTTSVEIDGSNKSLSPGSCGEAIKLDTNACLDRLHESYRLRRFTILSSEETSQSDGICIEFLSRALMALCCHRFNWNQHRHQVVQQDIHQIYYVMKHLFMTDSRFLFSKSGKRRYDCPCNQESCHVDDILNGLECQLDWNEYNEIYNGALLANTSIRNTRTSKLRVCLAVDAESIQSQSETDAPTICTSFISKYSQGNVIILSRSIQPLISITLSPVLNNGLNSNTDVLTNPLLRSCVKRLMVGRRIVHHETESDGSATSFKSLLTVCLPSNRDRNEKISLRYRVTGIQAKAVSSEMCQFVILPSTRIVFQASAEKSQSVDVQEQMIHMNPAQSFFSSAAKESKIKSILPHQHLIEALHSIFMFSSSNKLPLLRSFLFSGPPGVGKTFAVKQAISTANSWFGITKAKESEVVKLISIRGSELLATDGGQYAAAARELEKQFRLAVSLTDSNRNDGKDDATKVVIVFLDECDALVSSSMVLAAMLAMLLDRMESAENQCTGWSKLLVVAATNRVDAIPSFLRRPGRLEKEVVVSPPNTDDRFALLKSMLAVNTCNMSTVRVDVGNEDLKALADTCVGYVAADLAALVRRAATLGMERSFHNQDDGTSLSITIQDLINATNDVGASCLRDASLSAPPKTTWDDIAGDAGGAKQSLRQAIEWPRTRNAAFKALGLSPPRGVLLHGPPGCAKTTLARAAAGSAGVAFLSLSPADVYSSSYVGEAESVVRRAFDLARSAAPCVLFFDEIDSIIGGDDDSSGHGMGRGSSAEARVLSTFLNEMDGVDGSVEDGVLVLGATNRPRTLDAALLRPGRFDRVIYVPPPDERGRKDILRMECTKWIESIACSKTSAGQGRYSYDESLEQYFNLSALAKSEISGMMTGAEIVGACRETAVGVLRNVLSNRSSSVDEMTRGISSELLQALGTDLEVTLRKTQPLLSDLSVLEEYTRFDEEHKKS